MKFLTALLIAFPGICSGSAEISDEVKEALPNIVQGEFDFVTPAFVKKEYVDKLGEPLVSDVFVASWPKSGTNWVKQLVHSIRIRGDMAQVQAEEGKDLSDIVPYLEADPQVDHDNMLHPRVYQTHLRYGDLPKGGRVIYVIRDLPDIALSFYKYVQQWPGFLQNNTADEVAGMMMSGALYYGPWEQHIKSYWDVRDREDVLLVKYEDLKSDIQGEISRITAFLGIKLSEDETLRVRNLVSFDYMKQNAKRISGKEWSERVTGLATNPDYTLVNKGTCGNAGQFTPEVAAAMGKYWGDKMQPIVGAPTYSDFKV